MVKTGMVQIQSMIVNVIDSESDAETSVMVAEPELKEPSMYAVIMHNDDYTTMDFVTEVLQVEFKHSLQKALDIMLSIHHQGKAIVAVYPKDIAETKAIRVMTLAREFGYPLLVDIEPQN